MMHYFVYRKTKAGSPWSGVQRPGRNQAQSLPQEGIQEWDHTLGRGHGESSSADAQRHRPEEPPRVSGHQGVGGPAKCGAGHGRQPHERHLRPFPGAGRGFSHSGRRYHKVWELHRGGQWVQFCLSLIRRVSKQKLWHVLSSGAYQKNFTVL